MASRFGPQIIPRGGSGNATVPPDAPIQPPQAFVDCNTQLFQFGNANFSTIPVSRFDGTLAGNFVQFEVLLGGDPNFVVNNAGSSLPVGDINGTLSTIAGLIGIVGPGSIDLSGGTNAAPTQTQMNVSGAGTSAINGSYTQRGTASGKPFFNLVGQPDSNMAYCIVWTGTKWVILDSLGLVNYSSTDDTTLPSLATFSIDSGEIGVAPAPTLTSTNADQATLIADGWTVTTN